MTRVKTVEGPRYSEIVAVGAGGETLHLRNRAADEDPGSPDYIGERRLLFLYRPELSGDALRDFAEAQFSELCHTRSREQVE